MEWMRYLNNFPMIKSEKRELLSNSLHEKDFARTLFIFLSSFYLSLLKFNFFLSKVENIMEISRNDVCLPFESGIIQRENENSNSDEMFNSFD